MKNVINADNIEETIPAISPIMPLIIFSPLERNMKNIELITHIDSKRAKRPLSFPQ